MGGRVGHVLLCHDPDQNVGDALFTTHRKRKCVPCHQTIGLAAFPDRKYCALRSTATSDSDGSPTVRVKSMTAEMVT